MDLVLPILLGLAILASFFIAYMSSKTWPVYQTVLVVFVFLGCVVFFYMGARTLATHRSWGELVRRLDQETQTAEQQNLELRGGEQNAQGQAVAGVLRKLRQELEILVSSRGGMLPDVALDSVEDSVAKLTLKSPDHGLAPDQVLFVFDQPSLAEGGRYLGEFKVVKAEEGQPTVEITPNLPLSESQAKRLTASKGPWTLYTSMPIDDSVLFADLDEPTRGAIVPKESLAEYANRDRTLRDYELFFHENYVQRSLLDDAIAKVTSNVERTQAAAEETKREAGYRETERGHLQADFERFQFEVRTIAAYQKTLEDLLGKLQQRLKTVFVENYKLAAGLTLEQMKAAEAIDQRTALPSAAASR